MRLSWHNGLKYYICGEGEPLLLLHGFGISPLAYEKAIARLAQRFQVIAPDYSLAWSNQREIEETARRIKMLLNALKVRHKITIVGHSLGGLTGALFSAYFPEAVKRLVIIDGLAYPIDRNRWTYAVMTAVECTQNIFMPQGAAAMSRVARDFTQIIRRGLGTVYRQWTSISGLRIGNNTGLIRCPTTILWGENDKIIPKNIGLMLHRRLKHSLFFPIKSANHSWFLVDPGLLDKYLQ